MRIFKYVLAVALAVLVASASARGQGPKPGPEHEQLKKLAGTWEATVKLGGTEAKGTMTYREQQGGYWMVSHFSGDLGGQKFEGDGLDGYDPVKKRFVSMWTDSMTPEAMISEGTWDSEKKQMTMVGKGTGPDGKPAKTKTVTTWTDEDNIEFVYYMANGDGKEREIVRINYKRKK
jgi:hypothetical protein